MADTIRRSNYIIEKILNIYQQASIAFLSYAGNPLKITPFHIVPGVITLEKKCF